MSKRHTTSYLFKPALPKSLVPQLLLLIAIAIVFLCGMQASARAQTEIHISGAQSGFPIAIPRLCDEGGAGAATSEIAQGLAKNMDFSGFFRVINPDSYVQTSVRCNSPDPVAFSDWSVIGAEGLISGKVRSATLDSNSLTVELILYDVQQQRAVAGKRYEASASDLQKVIDRFSNEVVRYFTGTAGIFGSKIAYVSRIGRFKELFVMSATGEDQIQLTRDKGLALSPSWSPSGDRLVYTSYRTRKPELYFLEANGGAPKQLTNSDGLELGAEFSPDGTQIVSSSSVRGISNLVMMDLAGRIISRLTRGGSIDVSPTFSPDGRSIAFCSNRSGGPQIYVMDAAGGGARRVSHTASNYCTSPAWSPKGDKLAFVCRERANQIYVSQTDGSNVIQLTFAGNNEDPSWSPDGRYLAFSSDLGRGGPRNVVVMPLHTANARQITFAKSEASMPTWGPVPQ